MKNLYKQIFDDVKPDEKLLDSVFDMRDSKKKNHMAPKIVSAVLAFALVVGGAGFGVQYNQKQKIIDNPIAGVMLVNAAEPIGQSTTNIAYKIYVKDITGLTDEQIYDLKVETLTKDLNLSNDKATIKSGLKNNVFVNGNALYATERGMYTSSFKLSNIENPDDVESINVKNTSSYGNVVVNCNDLYFTEPEENVFVFDNSNVDTSKTNIQGHDITVDGSRYAFCRRIESNDAKKYASENYYNKDSEFYMLELSGTDLEFYISYIFTDDFYDALGKNPTMDLTTYDDDMTITVNFKDGYTATTVLNISLTDKGKMTAKCTSYDYSKTK